MKVKYLFATAIAMIALGAQATTPFKNLYVTAEVYPSGAGEVYLTTVDADKAYIAEETGDWGESVVLKATIGENGGQDQYAGYESYVEDATGTLGMYEAIIKVRPAEGYEFVCLATELSPSDIYEPYFCLQRHTGTQSSAYEFFWNYEMDAENRINVNSDAREVDMTSDEGTQQTCFENYGWSDEPDRQIYAIFRKIGEDMPCFEDGRVMDLVGDVDGNEEVNMDDAKALAEYLVGLRPEINTEYADANGDNSINIADALAIVKKVMKQ